MRLHRYMLRGGHVIVLGSITILAIYIFQHIHGMPDLKMLFGLVGILLLASNHWRYVALVKNIGDSALVGKIDHIVAAYNCLLWIIVVFILYGVHSS